MNIATSQEGRATFPDYFSLLAFQFPDEFRASADPIAIVCALPDGSNARIDMFFTGDTHSRPPSSMLLCQNGHAKA